MRAALCIALIGAALVVAACGGGGVSKGTDLANGRNLFIKGANGKPACGSCHTLAAAGTTGTLGPNLDDAFRADREQGFKESTVEQVVREQIRLPALGSAMPPNLVTGTDADDVAYFVAHCAGNPDNPDCQPPSGGKITATDGKTIFEQAGCVSCHTLAAANATGTVGPNLDQAKPSKQLVIERVTNGKGAMPSFKDKLSQAQIEAVATFVSENAGK